jgi:hypothetical protein
VLPLSGPALTGINRAANSGGEGVGDPTAWFRRTTRCTDPHEVLNLILFIFVAVGQLAAQLKRHLELAH